MSTPNGPDRLLDAVAAARSAAPLLEALGFEPTDEPVPRDAWPAYGVPDTPELRALRLAGCAGSLYALVLETAPSSEPARFGAIARRIHARNPARLHFLVFAEPDYSRLTLGVLLADDFHQLRLERGRVRHSDAATIREMMPGDGETGLALTLRFAAALDRSRLTQRFFRDFRIRRGVIAEAWSGIPADATHERDRLALLFLSRLTFLYFLQRRGALADDDQYLARLYGEWIRLPDDTMTSGASSGPCGFYRGRLVPLFFESLNRRPQDRPERSRGLGPLPYLNGGLFEPHALERRFQELDLPDREIGACFDELFERYRFTVDEDADGSAAVDPEILGRVFEGLMEPGERSDTGSFYTPAPVVNRVVREALTTYVTGSLGPGSGAVGGAIEHLMMDGSADGLPAESRHRVRNALERVRILDPACGSGAFLLGALQRLARALGAVSPMPPGAVRRHIVARSLHGVDLLDDAALLCSLRLWLALAVADEEIHPLPNLDRRIRQGDALVDPLDLGSLEPSDDGATWHPLRDPEVCRALRGIRPAARQYIDSEPQDRPALRSRLEQAEQRLARSWLHGARDARHQRLRRLRAQAEERDLFGEVPTTARNAAVAVERMQKRIAELDLLTDALDEQDALPFFSFGVHFAEAAGGFDVVISNPPWVRVHRWPDRIRRLAQRYEVCRQPGWARAAALTGAPAAAGTQVDLSLLFLERAIRLLAPGGVLAILLPAKALRALYGGAARRLVLRELDLELIEDHALDQRAMFRADAFAAILIGRKRTGEARPESEVRVRITRRGSAPLEIRVRQDRLPLVPEDPTSPWLLAPPEAASALRSMQRAGPPIGEHPGLRVRRGIMTGANDILLFPSVRPKLSGLAIVEAVGGARAATEEDAVHYRSVVELDALRPVVRGADIDAFRYGTGTYAVWCHDGRGDPEEPPPRMATYLERHRQRLERRAGWRPGMPLGRVFRLTPKTMGPKVAWHDLSDTLRAVALPSTVSSHGADRELIPLNTVYFLPVETPDQAILLAGLLNSMPVRTLARAYAERAKDARFRFFAWTVASLPLPTAWETAPEAERVRALSRRGHTGGGLSRDEYQLLDRAVASLYRLSDEEIRALAGFDAWLRGHS